MKLEWRKNTGGLQTHAERERELLRQAQGHPWALWVLQGFAIGVVLWLAGQAWRAW